MNASLAKPGRNQFKCFHCRQIFAQRDGDWFDWNHMQVHLCRSCDKATATSRERSYSGG